MSDMKATVEPTSKGFSVCGYEKIEYDFEFLDGVLDPAKPQLAECYQRWKRCLAIMDMNMFELYGDQMQRYFDHYGIDLKVHQTKVGEKAKNMDTLLGIVDSMNEFGVYRKEPVLVFGGGLVTDVAGFACAAYRRNTNFIRIPTTVIGLIDASVSIKVAVNYGNYKNRLGAYHAPIHTFLDFTFLRTLPVAQIRNGFAELIKISSCADKTTFDLLDAYCEDLIATGFGRADGSPDDLKKAADRICRAGIHEMLKLETPNLHEIMLDRIIAYGHTPMGDCVFLNDVTHEEMCKALEVHKGIMAQFARAGAGIDAYVDASDTGEIAEVPEKMDSAGSGHYTTTSTSSAYQPVKGVPAMHAGGDLPRVVDNLKGSMDQSARSNNVVAVADGGLQ
ncbi:unnamed protein product [Clonostachys rosea f. rosea IK726]|uniref:Uncharacterized protein n=1 Tax=Clonostachys rosea f. rosea IK726 TaxID=1349383 RepID=A0ACA9TH99_BIOOC|nr:unnamed protein product [Clonostachys rosea f. rosea IK726]